MSENIPPIDLKEVIKKLKAEKKRFYYALPITCVCTYLIIFCIPRYYTSSVSMAPEPTGSMPALSGSLSSLASSFGLSSLSKMNSSDALNVDIYPDIISSYDFLAELMTIEVETKDGEVKTNYYQYLRDHQAQPWWGYIVGTVSNWFSDDEGIDSINGQEKINIFHLTKKQDALFGLAQKNIACAIDKKTDIISIVVKDQDPKVCALMADSTSRWAEALREMSGRLEEMPGEEGYPAYLGSRLAEFYERAGRVMSLGREPREGYLSVVGAVSPPGGDISEPVSQATLRVVKVFWALDAELAYQRHFPAINWLTSYSQYLDNMEVWFDQNVDESWMTTRQHLMSLLQEEASLNDIVKMVGMDALSPQDRLKMEAARSIREDFLHQNSFDEIDTYTSLQKQYYMMKLVYAYYEEGSKALENGADINDLVKIPSRELIGRYKYTKESDIEAQYQLVMATLTKEISSLIGKEDD